MVESGVEAQAGAGPSTFEAFGENLLASLFDLAEPQPKYKALLDQCPVHRAGEGAVIVASRAAADAVLRSSGGFSAAGLINLGNVRPLIPLSIDPPDHVKYRKILDPLFTPKKMDALEDDITNRVNVFIDAFEDRGSCHFTDELAIPFPSSVFLGLMGLPSAELGTFLRLKEGILRPGGDHATPEERARIQNATGQEIYDYFNSALDEREKQPQEDILTQFLEAEIEGDKLTREDILDICFLFLIAGLDTVTDSLTCMFAFLARHPEHRRQIAEDPTIIPAAVEELLRWETPVTSVFRSATSSGELAGCPYVAGDVMAVQLGAANLDPEEFERPFDVNFHRESNRHIAFGGGVHRCLGSHLARRELRITLREWHRRIPDYRLAPDIELHYPMGLRTVENLQLEW
jgi:cytochrome P450